MRKEVTVDMSLLLTEVDMKDELWNPFPSGYGQFFFLDAKETPSVKTEEMPR